MDFLSDKRFLDGIHGYERQLAKLLATVFGFPTIVFFLYTGAKIISLQVNWFDGSLINLIDRLLLIFVALKVLQNIAAYLRDQVVQIELVLPSGTD